MTNKNKMLQLVLSDEKLISFYEYNASDFQTIDVALKSENPIVVAVAKIIQGVSMNPTSGNYKETYNEVINYLNKNLL